MTNRVYWVNGAWFHQKRNAEKYYKSLDHARMEVWDNAMDHHTARFLKKK